MTGNSAGDVEVARQSSGEPADGSCVSCGHALLRAVRRYRTTTKPGRQIFSDCSLYECGNCGLVQVSPRPTLAELAEYYAVDYREGLCAGSDVADSTKFPKDNLFYYNRGQSAAELIGNQLANHPLRILDVGAGWGHILHALGQRFPNSTRYAIELSEVCIRHLRSLGIEVFAEAAEDVLPRIDQTFDLIVISHVLEHVLDPLRMIRQLHDRLAPGGHLFVEVPHIPADSPRRYPDHVWAPRFDEPHITFFSPATLSGALESAGLEVSLCETAGPEYRYISSLRYRTPTLRWLVQRWIPDRLFHFLRRQAFTQPLRVQEREEAFYRYGGLRIWVRCLGRKREAQSASHGHSR